MTARNFFPILILTFVLVACKGDTEQIKQFNLNVYCYVFNSNVVASCLSDNIEGFRYGRCFFDRHSGKMEYSDGEYCTSIEEVASLTRGYWEEQRIYRSTIGFARDAKYHLPKGYPELANLYILAKEFEYLAFKVEPTGSYPEEYRKIFSHFFLEFTLVEDKYPKAKIDKDRAYQMVSNINKQTRELGL